MKLIVKYKDTETQPQFIINEEGKVTEIIIEAPFIIMPKSRPAKNEDKVIEAFVGLTKRCVRCGEEKPLESYHRSRNATGVQSICIKCKKEERKYEDE